MNAVARLLIRLYHIELDGMWGRGDQIYLDVWLTNDLAAFKDFLGPQLAKAAGNLEYCQFRPGCVAAYSKLEKVDIKSSEEALALLSCYLYLIQSFLGVLWVVKDHSVNFEVGFLQVVPESGDPYFNSNLINTSQILAGGGKRQIHFTREEVRVARHLFLTNFYLASPPHEFKKSSPFFQAKDGFEIASWKGSLRFERFFFFIVAARSQSDLGLKLAIYCTALEALFSTDANELTHKIAERVACFMGASVEERLALYQKVKTAYSIRSKVLHGDIISEKAKQELTKVSVDLDSILRQIARQIMEVRNLAVVFDEDSKLDGFFSDSF